MKKFLLIMSAFICTASMEAYAWSFNTSMFSAVDYTFSVNGNKYKLSDGNWVVSSIYEYNYGAVCINVKSSNITVHSGDGNRGAGVISLTQLSESDDSGRDKGTHSATGSLLLNSMFQHYKLKNGNDEACYESSTLVNDAGEIVTFIDPNQAPTGNCNEDDINPDHVNENVNFHVCHADSVNKVEYKDLVWMPKFAVYVQVVEGDETGPYTPYNTLTHGIAECTWQDAEGNPGELHVDTSGAEDHNLDHYDNIDCPVTVYKTWEDPIELHDLSKFFNPPAAEPVDEPVL
ncbi:MAG: hypothetical protein OEY09_15925 [Gammaproteobacteria bacterium]|nr:hypothetical protein [Gammaproteobacteria bacterium]